MTVSIDDQIKEVKRELGMRRSVYPRWVSDRRLSQTEADIRTGRLEAVLATLEKVKADNQPQGLLL